MEYTRWHFQGFGIGPGEKRHQNHSLPIHLLNGGILWGVEIAPLVGRFEPLKHQSHAGVIDSKKILVNRFSSFLRSSVEVSPLCKRVSLSQITNHARASFQTRNITSW